MTSLLVATVLLSAPQGHVASDLVTVGTGTLPIIITAPHGGNLPIDDVPLRTAKSGAKQFSTAYDLNTDKLALAIADAIEKRSGARPYVVVAQFSRKYIDANRPAADGYESDRAKLVYDRYHDAVQRAREEILKKFGTGLLIDVHGQGKEPDAIFRGTANLATVQHLIAKSGKESLVGADGLLGSIARKGYRFIPTCDSPDKENASFDGGWTVRHYGSIEGGNFDAVQIEFGYNFRKAAAIPKTANDLADSVAAFAKKYLPNKAAQR